VHGDSGVLLDDPRDLAAYGAAVAGLLDQPDLARRMGERARERVRDRFLSVRTLLDYLEVIRSALDRVHAPSVHRSHA
jgi:trehalose synthase